MFTLLMENLSGAYPVHKLLCKDNVDGFYHIAMRLLGL